MKCQGRKIHSHMVRGARINDPIQEITRIRVMNCSVGIRCCEGPKRSSGRGGWKRSNSRGGQRTALSSRVPSYTTNLTTPSVATAPEL